MIKKNKTSIMKSILANTFIFIFVVLVVLPLVFAEGEEVNEGTRVNQSLSLAEENLNEFLTQGLTAVRYNDTLLLAKQLYEAQIALIDTGGEPEYSPIVEKLDEMNKIRKNAFRANDELNALEQTWEVIEDKENLGEAFELFDQAKETFKAERYEETLDLIDQTYEKVSELQALDTKVKALYDATTGTITEFLKKNQKIILQISGGLLVLYLIMRRTLKIWKIKRNIHGLERRKESLYALIGRTQKDYFDAGKLDENTYHIRITKYGEMVRDINRQVPTLNEELAKLKGSRTTIDHKIKKERKNAKKK